MITADRNGRGLLSRTDILRRRLPAAVTPVPATDPASTRRHSVRFTLGLFAAFIVPSVLLCGLLGRAWVSSEQDRLTGSVAAQVARAADEVDQYLSGHLALLKALGTSPALDTNDFARLRDQIRQLFAPERIEVALRDGAGHVLFRTGAKPDGGTGLGLKAGRSEASFSDLIRRGSGGYVVLSVPVMHGDAVRFVLEAEVDATVFAEVLRRSGLGPQQLASLADRQGRVIARTEGDPPVYGQTIAGFAERVGAKGVWIGKNPRGLPVRMSYERLPEAGWMVSVGMTEEAFRAPLIHSIQWLAAICALIVLVAILLLVPLVRQRIAFQRAVAETQGRLRTSEERLALALDSGDDGLFDWDRTTDAVWLSPRWSAKLGYPADAPTRPGAFYAEAVHPDDREELDALMQAHLAGTSPAIEAEYRRRCADGHYLWVLLRARVVERDAAGLVLRIVGTLMDISRRKEAELHVIHLAHHDALTGLGNRALFHHRLSEVLERSRRGSARYAVLACDLDRFKAVNDTFGHAEGDRLLCTVAERICAVLSPQDTVARLGGDEFAVILGEIPDDEAIHAACERIIAAIGAPIPHHGGTIDIAVSIGVALVSGSEATAEEVFRQADMAMYQAKAAGRNTYCLFEATVLTRNSTRGLLALDMKDAIRRGDFFLVYQPVIDVDSGAVVSFEALMRWQHPTRGMISPVDFIPVAEETGMIAQLGAWALVEACREALTWDEDLWIGVNVSPVQFRCGLEQAVLTALATTGLLARRLKLEVTEGVLMQDADGAIACLHRLRALGVRIALDDFGTGYSSLSYLRRFPFDKLKIDRAFIRDITEPDAAAIIRAVVGIGQSLGMSIVAEGVETVEQLEAVRREGCNEVQGFLFSKPLPAAEARAFVANRAARAA